MTYFWDAGSRSLAPYIFLLLIDISGKITSKSDCQQICRAACWACKADGKIPRKVISIWVMWPPWRVTSFIARTTVQHGIIYCIFRLTRTTFHSLPVWMAILVWSASAHLEQVMNCPNTESGCLLTMIRFHPLLMVVLPLEKLMTRYVIAELLLAKDLKICC